MKNSKQQIYVFCDFDGTISLDDIGDRLFEKYSKIEPFNTQLKNQEINIYQYWNILCDNLIPNFSKQHIIDFIKNSEIDFYFNDFVKICNNNKIHIEIVSDGFSDYIAPLLAQNNLELPVYSNYLKFFEDRVEPFFPKASESCKCFCASCKRNTVLNKVGDDDFIIYIGDGYSDFCVAEHSDIIFAKGNLLRYCVEKKLPHYHFKSFFDIKKILQEIILTKNKLKHRRQAQLKRKIAFEVE